MFTLYHFPRTAGFAPHCLLKHVGAPFQLTFVDKDNEAQKTADYLQLNPVGRIPTLVHEGHKIFESPAICIYISELYPEYRLIPSIGDPLRAQFFQWLAFLTNTLQAELLIYYHPERYTLSKAGMVEVIKAVEQRINEALSIIDKQLEGHDYLLGDDLTACDYFLFMLVDWAMCTQPSLLAHLNLANYLKRIAQDPIVQAVCQLEGIDTKPFHCL